MSDNELIKAGQTAPATTQEIDLFQMIGQAASDESFDANKMQALIDMKIQMDAIDAKKAFTKAMVEFSKLKPRIIKNKDGHNNKYASLDSIIRQIRQPLFDCGFTYNWLTDTNDNLTRVTCVLSHIEGHSIESSMEQGADKSGKKNDLQGVGSTMSYLKRYTLRAVTGIVEEGEDNDGIQEAVKQSIDESQIIQLEQLIKETETELPRFCKAFKIGSISEMDSAKFGLAVKQLNAKKGK